MSQKPSSTTATLWTVERDTTTSQFRAPDDRPVPIPGPVRWVVGALIGVAGLSFLTVNTNDRIESALVDRTESALAEAGLDPTDFTIDFEFRDGTVAGSLPDGWTPARFHAAIEVDGARTLELSSTEPATS